MAALGLGAQADKPACLEPAEGLGEHLAGDAADQLQERAVADGGKRELVDQAGPDEVIDYTDVDFADAVRDVDVIFDNVGGDTEKLVLPHWPVGQHAPTAAITRFAGAEALLLEHAREPITVSDIADAAGLSIRGVQAAFNRHDGTTAPPPLAYLRHIRLLLAREQLESDRDVSVAEVTRWAGFAHLGRFAGAYRDEFGELPRQTRQASGRW